MPRKQSHSNGKTVWLVTWEWAGLHARRDDKVAAIFNPRYSSERVRDLIERIYSADYSLSEKLAYALQPNKNPYLATFGALNGHSWTGEIICGHNPFLNSPWCKSVNSRPSEIGFWFGDRIWMRREAGRFGVSLRSRADFGR